MATTDPVDLAVRALAHRDRPRAEIEKRLAQAGVSEGAREEALATLERLGYLDDRRFARSRASALAARGYGDTYIRHDLAEQGVLGEAADDALAALEPEPDRAQAAAERHGRTAKTVAHLARKGFAQDSLEGMIARDRNVP